MRRLVFCLMGLALIGPVGAQAAAKNLPPTSDTAEAAEDKPVLVLDAGGHTGSVLPVLFTPDGRELISVSSDGTIRCWSMETGQTLRVLRPMLIPGGRNGNFQYGGAALSPDGKTLAAARGDTANKQWILLIDLASERITRLIPAEHTGSITRLRFSPDGGLLASAAYDSTARLWNVATGACDRVFRGHRSSVHGLAFSPDGKHLATSSADETARVWSVATGETEVVLKDAEKRANPVSSVAFSPDAKTIVTGHFGNGIRLWNRDGTLRKRLAPDENDHDICFTSDPNRLLIAGSGGAVLDLTTGEVLAAKYDRRTSSWGCAASPDGKLAATSGEGGDSLYVWRISDGGLVYHLTGKGRFIFGVGWSSDGKQVGWGNTNGIRNFRWADLPADNETHPLEAAFSLTDLQLTGKPEGKFRRYNAVSGDLSMKRNGNTGRMTVMRGAEPLAQLPPTFAAAYSFLSDEQVLLGANGAVGLYETRTGRLVRQLFGNYPVAELSVSPDGRFLLTGASDQVLRIWLLNKSKLLLSLFVAGDDWVAWTPEGYYAASPGGEQLMGWQVNNGPDQMGSYYPASQFRKTLYRPDVIKRLLAAGGVEKALTQADEERGKTSRRTEVAQVLPPKVGITSPKERGLHVDKAALHVEAVANGGENNPVSSPRLLLDGRPFGDDALRRLPRPEAGEARAAWDVELPAGTHRLTVEAAGKASVGLSDALEVVFTPAGQDADKITPAGSLYVLAIGINAYPGELRLECAAPDARSVDEAFRKDSKALFKDVKTRLLVDDRAGRRAVLEGLDWLKGQAKPGDMAVVFYAGHGTTRKGQFFLLPADMDLKDIGGTGLSGDDLRGRLGALPCTALLVLDACYSGAFDQGKKSRGLPAGPDGLVRALVYDEGLVVMCGASKEQEAAEEKGHGFFTRALVEGLSGKAASKRDGVVYLTGLQQYVEERVAELSGGEQAPTLGKPSTVRSFPLAKP